MDDLFNEGDELTRKYLIVVVNFLANLNPPLLLM